LKAKLVDLVADLMDKGRFVKYTRLDDAGENAYNERACKLKFLDIKSEFSGPR
jgi:hypothetical protein